MDEQITPGMRIVSIPQAAAEGLLNVSALRTLVREGTIPSMMIGSRAYINLDVARDIVYKLSVRGAKKEDKTEDDMPVETNDPEGNSMASIVPERFYTSSEVREILRIGKSAYYKLIERRDMPHIEMEGKFLIKGTDLLRYIADRTVG